MQALETLAEGFAFLEGPRWHDGRLWVSDMHDHRVLTLDAKGRSETICEVSQQPSGLGWLPDGRLLVVSMVDRRVLRLEAQGLVEHADLSGPGLASFHCNDMVVDARGRAYVGNFGFDFQAGEEHREKVLLLVEPDGSVRVVADGLSFPNGSVITPDGRTLVVGESWAARLTAFDIHEDGSLHGRRVWAALPGAVPDGCCLDAEGAIWVASPMSSELLRVREGGEVLARVPTQQMAIACMLGGADRRTLFVLTAPSTQREECRRLRSARIETLRVDVPGAGRP
jgi:sugar lactone lactonase YvrE